MAGQWFSPSPPFPPTKKANRHDTIVILLKVALNTTTLPPMMTWSMPILIGPC